MCDDVTSGSRFDDVDEFDDESIHSSSDDDDSDSRLVLLDLSQAPEEACPKIAR
jgi:hypothetical protein